MPECYFGQKRNATSPKLSSSAMQFLFTENAGDMKNIPTIVFTAALLFLYLTDIKEPDFFNLLTELLPGHWPLKAKIRKCCHQLYGECTC